MRVFLSCLMLSASSVALAGSTSVCPSAVDLARVTEDSPQGITAVLNEKDEVLGYINPADIWNQLRFVEGVTNVDVEAMTREWPLEAKKLSQAQLFMYAFSIQKIPVTIGGELAWLTLRESRSGQEGYQRILRTVPCYKNLKEAQENVLRPLVFTKTSFPSKKGNAK